MIVGVDEAGRGPVIGPLVVASLGIPESQINILEELGVNDSKALSPSKRLEIRNKILTYKNWKYSIVEFSAEQIDRAMEHDTLNSIEVRLFAKAINDIGSEHISKLILDACDVNQERFGRNVYARIKPTSEKLELISEHKADSKHLIVGAASILAKVHRDLEIERIKQECGFQIGSGYPSDPKTKDAIPSMITGDLPHINLRWSWATVERAWKEAGKGKLPLRPRISQNARGQSSLDSWYRQL
tara:strand:+ start:14697 stop:15425 length:729 start_codon:yes stop_codon:yes gene_type:complete